MISFFSYLREKAREAVLAGVQDALDQIDPILANHTSSLSPPNISPIATPTVPATPQLAVLETTPSSPPSEPVSQAPPPSPGGLQERLAQATNAIESNATAIGPPKPSSPIRGRGRPGKGGES